MVKYYNRKSDTHVVILFIILVLGYSVAGNLKLENVPGIPSETDLLRILALEKKVEELKRKWIMYSVIQLQLLEQVSRLRDASNAEPEAPPSYREANRSTTREARTESDG